MTFAEAKGLKGSRLFFRWRIAKYAKREQVTALAMQLGPIVSGATLVEVCSAIRVLVTGWVAQSGRSTIP